MSEIPSPKLKVHASGPAISKSSEIVAAVKRARDPRSIRSKNAVLEAAKALYLEAGQGGFSIKAIVANTGIARSTVYRHWPTQTHLLTAVIARVFDEYEIPDHGNLRADLIEYYLVRTHGVFATPHSRTFQSLPGLLQAAQGDPTIINVVNFIIVRFTESLRVMVKRAQTRREVDGASNVENIVRVIHGAMSSQALRDEQQSDEQIIEMIDILLNGIQTA